MKNKISGLFILVALVANSLTFTQTKLIATASAQSSPPPVCRVVPINWGGGLDVRGYDFSTPKQRLLPGQMVAFRKEWSDSHIPHDAGTEYDELQNKTFSVSGKPCDFSSLEVILNKCLVELSYGGARIRTTHETATQTIYSKNYCKIPSVGGSAYYYNLKINNKFNFPENSCPEGSANCQFYFFYR